MNEDAQILIAEDDEQIRFLLNFALEREGFTINQATNGKEAIEQLKAMKQPKLALLDVMMPYIDGISVLKEIRNSDNWKDVPVVMLTAKSQESDIVQALNLGATDYFIKPFQPVEIVTRLKRIMGLLGG